MSSIEGQIAEYGTDLGTSVGQKMVCQHLSRISSRGIWLNDSPFDFPLPTLLAQLTLFTLFIKVVYFILKPLKQSITSAQIIAGIVLSPSVLLRISPSMAKLHPVGGKLLLKTFSEIGFMLHLFVMGVQTDINIIKKAGRSSMVIGTLSYVVPCTLSAITNIILMNTVNLEKLNLGYLGYMATMNSMSAFPVITSILAELKILNSEIGRLAAHTVLTCDICGWIVSIFMSALVMAKRSLWSSLGNLICIVVFVLIIIFILRPFILWLVKRTPEKAYSNDANLCLITLIVLACGLWSELLGLHGGLGPYILGVVLPDGPPLGSSLATSLGTLSNELFAPTVFAISGFKTNFFTIEANSAVVIELVIMVGNIGKFVGTLLPALFFGVPFWDAFSLSLILGCKGIVDATSYIHLADRSILDIPSFTLLIVNVLLVTGIAKPLVSYLYDPSKRYMTYTRRTIQHGKRDSQLRILVCYYNHDNIPTILNILEASNPTRYNPIAVFAMLLNEMTGRATAILVPHHHHKSVPGGTDQIANAFINFEQQHMGCVVVQYFIAIAPYAIMHNDICTVAVDKRTTIVILPFHKKGEIDGTIDTSSTGIRILNQNVIDKAPCTVGILVDRGAEKSGTRQSFLGGNSPPFRVTMIFLGGPDDLEALAYSIRMAEHPNVSLTIVHVKHPGFTDEKFCYIIRDLRVNSTSPESIIYREEIVKDGVETTNLIRLLENDVDLLIVGRQQQRGSPVLLGLEAWNENLELGVLGDVLATWDFRFSVLVVQQQPLTSTMQRVDNFKRKSNRYKAVQSRVFDHGSLDEDGEFAQQNRKTYM